MQAPGPARKPLGAQDIAIATPRGVSTSWTTALASAAGAGAFLVAVWLLAPGIRELLESRPIVNADRQAAEWLHAATGTALIGFAHGLSVVHGTLGILLMTAIAAAVLRASGGSQSMPFLFVAVPGGLLLNVAVKHLVERARPQWGYAFETLESFSFPSGHTAGTTLLYGVVVALLWHKAHAAGARVALVAAAASLVLLVAGSRIVLGVHFLSDCIAAVVEALLWLTICRAIVRRSSGRAPSPGNA